MPSAAQHADYWVNKRIRAAWTAEELAENTRADLTGAVKVDAELPRALKDAERAAASASAEHNGVVAAIERAEREREQAAAAVTDAEANQRPPLIAHATAPTSETAAALKRASGRLDEARQKLQVVKSTLDALHGAKVEATAKAEATTAALESARRQLASAELDVAEQKALAAVCDAWEDLTAKIAPLLTACRGDGAAARVLLLDLAQRFNRKGN